MTSEYRARFPSTRRAAARARRLLMECVATFGYAPTDLADIETAIGEALANAAEHGHRPGGAFDVAAYVDGGVAVIEVLDEGAGFTTSLAEPATLPRPDVSRGFGIFLMRELMDSLEYDEQGRCVRLKKRLPATVIPAG